MLNHTITVANLKCSGCAATIRGELMKMRDVSSVEVDVDQDTVTLSGDNFSREDAVARLHALGYPEATEKNGLLLQLKSYASCMLGKIKNASDQANQSESKAV